MIWWFFIVLTQTARDIVLDVLEERVAAAQEAVELRWRRENRKIIQQLRRHR